MAHKRNTPPDDFERFAENLYNYAAGNIKDRDSFDAFFNKYLQDTFTNAQDTELRDKTFDILTRKYQVVDEKLFSDAGGKNLLLDRKKNAKVITTDKDKYKKLGAQRSDYAGLDTKPDFTFTGRIKRKVVFARATTVKVRGKEITRYRDRKGRFVSVKK